ncbi:MAG: serine hydrolase [Clostridiales Family XIII bacterium]|nr:serine hydrolase [Clostridiales Family XIII bacterium]
MEKIIAIRETPPPESVMPPDALYPSYENAPALSKAGISAKLSQVLGKANPMFDTGSIYSGSALLCNVDTGDILVKKREKERVYPASLTKLMTALIAIEHMPSLPEKIRFNKDIFPALYKANSTMAGFLPGEEAHVQDIIYGAVLESGGECCVALAYAIAGSEAGFVRMMNARARELQMNDTHFANVTGLHDDRHFTTAKDLGKLLLFALNNSKFKEVFTAKEYMTSPTDLRAEGRLLKNGAMYGFGALDFEGGVLVGGKSGYTDEAGLCLATMAVKKGTPYIFISTGNGIPSPGFAYSFADAINAYENGIL